MIATNKDGKTQFCMNYRALNARMRGDRWPIPQTEEIFDGLQWLEYFTTLDLFTGYYRVLMCECCKEKTEFVCLYGTYRFEVKPFGLMNAPSTFQRMVDDVLKGLDFVRVYLDDLVIFSKTFENQM